MPAMLTDLLREDARWAMPPAALWFDGRAAIARLFAAVPDRLAGRLPHGAGGANRQPAAAAYLRLTGDRSTSGGAATSCAWSTARSAEVTRSPPACAAVSTSRRRCRAKSPVDPRMAGPMSFPRSGSKL